MATDKNSASLFSRMLGTLSSPVRIASFGGSRGKIDPVAVDANLGRLSQVSNGSDRMPVTPTLSLEEATREAYALSHFVHGCVSKIASAVSQVPWGLEKRSVDRQWTPVLDSDYEALLERPNPFMSGQDLFERWTLHLILTGNCIGLKVRPVSGSSTRPKEIWPVQPDLIRPVPDKLNYLSHYELLTDGNSIPIDPKDVIHIQIADPRNPFWGMSPLVALGRIIATEVDALTWWRQNIRNRASKLGYISFQNELTPEQYDQVQQSLIAQATGPWNAGLPFVLGNEAKWTPGSSTPAEMDFTNLRKMTREEICGVLGVSPILMGIQDFSSYNNIVTARLMLWLDTVCPILSNMRSALDMALLVDFINPSEIRQYQTGYDLTNVDALVANMVNVISVAQALFGMGVPFSQINARLKLGFSKYDGWDTSWLPSGLIPSEQLAENAASGGGMNPGRTSRPGPVSDARADRMADSGTFSKPPSGFKRKFSQGADSAEDALSMLRKLIPEPGRNGIAAH